MEIKSRKIKTERNVSKSPVPTQSQTGQHLREPLQKGISDVMQRDTTPIKSEVAFMTHFKKSDEYNLHCRKCKLNLVVDCRNQLI